MAERGLPALRDKAERVAILLALSALRNPQSLHQIRHRTDSLWRTSPRLRRLILPSFFFLEIGRVCGAELSEFLIKHGLGVTTGGLM
jgi:hypothetical protein